LLHALLLVVVAAGPAWAGGARLQIAATSTDLASLVTAVGGESVHVDSLAPPLHDPHTVTLKPGHLARLKTADLLVRIGLDHEPWLTRALNALPDTRLRPGTPHDLDLARTVELLATETPRLGMDRRAHVHGYGNPHYWLDPENARPMTAAIAAALTALAPAGRTSFEANRARFLQRLDAGLTRWKGTLAPHRGARIVVVHDSWAYFARRFGLLVVGAVEPTPGVPPSPAAVSALIQRMREGPVGALVAEPYADAALVRQIASRSGVPSVTLVPSVGGDPEARDYIALFDVNVRRLAGALAKPR
jgi:ABC-type Zn uptake system ZnuABC Zn-binding protein ZnuA